MNRRTRVGVGGNPIRGMLAIPDVRLTSTTSGCGRADAGQREADSDVQWPRATGLQARERAGRGDAPRTLRDRPIRAEVDVDERGSGALCLELEPVRAQRGQNGGTPDDRSRIPYRVDAPLRGAGHP